MAPAASVLLTFSEAMQKPSVEGAISLFPPPPGGVTLQWRGPRLEIAPDSAWAAAQTYVLTVQAEARDLRGNRLGQTLQMAFSTGTRIDSGAVQGRIMRDGRPARGATALCYRLEHAGINPESDTADYVVLADSLGQFQFGFLGPGRYRVFGLDDRDRDWLWNIGTEAIAVPARDVEVLEQPSVFDLPPLMLTPLDTAQPQILDCRMVAPGLGEIDCSQGLDSARLGRQTLRLGDSAHSGGALAVFAPDSTARRIYVHLPDFAAGARRALEVDFEHPGTGRRSTDTCIIEAPERWEPPAAELPLQIEPDSAVTALAWVRGVRIRLAVPAAGLAVGALTWRAGARVGEAPCSLSSPFTVELVLPSGAEAGGPIELELPAHSVDLLTGGTWPDDSLRRVRVPFPFRDSVGEYDLKALVSDVQEQAFLRVGFRPAGTGVVTWTDAGADGTLRGALQRGDYLLTLFADHNRDGHRDAGWPYPYRPSEPVWPVADTLHVRARFTTELTVTAAPKKQLP